MAAKASVESPPNTALLVPIGPYAGKPALKLKKTIIVIGSTEQCHLRLLSSTVSKLHALLVKADDGVYIRDLASRSKVIVNALEQRESELSDGDEIAIGRFSFKFTSPALPLGLSVHAPPATVNINGKPALERIDGRVLLIGRMAGCDVRLAQEAVSTRHAAIFEAGGKRYLRDFYSRGGTFLNGVKIHQQEIKFGDEIRIGATTLTLARVADSAAAADAEPPIELDLEHLVPIEAPPVRAAAPLGTVETRAVPSQAPAAIVELPAATSESSSDHINLNADLSDSDLSADTQVDAPAVTEPAAEAAAAEEPALPLESDAPVPQDRPINFQFVASGQEQPPPEETPAIDLGEIAEADRPRRGWRSDSWREGAPETPGGDAQARSAIPNEPVVDLVPLEGEETATVNTGAVAPPLPDEIPDVSAPSATAGIAPGAATPAQPAAPADLASPPADEPIFELAAPATSPISRPATPPLEPIAPPLDQTLASEPSPAAVDISAPVELRPPAPPVTDEIADVSAPSAIAGVASGVATPAQPAAPTDSAAPPADETNLELSAPATSPISRPATPPLEPIAPPLDQTLASGPSPAAVDVPATTEPPPPAEPAPPVATEATISEPIPSEPVPAATEVPATAETPVLAEPTPPAPPEAAASEPIPAPLVKPRRGRSPKRAPKAQEAAPAPKISRRRSKRIPPPKPNEDSIEPVEPVSNPPALPVELAEVATVTAEAAVPLASMPPVDLSAFPVPEAQAEPIELASGDLSAPAEQPAPEPAPTMPSVDLTSFPSAEKEPEPAMQLPDGDVEVHEVHEPHVESEIFEGSVHPEPQKQPEPAIAGLELRPEQFAAAASEPVAPPSTPAEAPVAAELTPPPHDMPPSATGEVLDGGESSPESTLDLDMSLPPLPAAAADASSPAEPAVAEPSDSAFGAMVESFTGNATGALIESETPAPSMTAHPDQVSVPDGSGFSFNSDSTIDRVAPPAQVFATTDSTTTEPLPPAPAAPAPQAPPRSPPEPDEAPLTSFGGMGIFGAASVDLDHFLGGMPLALPELAPPPPSFGRIGIRFDARRAPMEPVPTPPTPPDQPAQPERVQTATPPGIMPPEKPEQVQTAPPPAVKPPPKIKPPAPFATRPINMSSEDELPGAFSAGAAALGGSGLSGAATFTTAFDGLAMPPVRHTDVFSECEAISTNDAAFGGASLNRADDYALPESAATAARLADGSEKDFAEDEFWNRTDEEEGLPPMGLPRPAAKGSDGGSDAPGVTAAEERALASGDYDRDPSRLPPTPPAAVEGAPTKRGKFRLPPLLLVMLLSVGAALGAVWLLVSPKSEVVGKVTYLNYAWTPATKEGNEFEAEQRRLLNDDHTRSHAAEIFQQSYPDLSRGFLELPALYNRAIANAVLTPSLSGEQPRTVIELKYDGADGIDDGRRMGALLQALIAANAPVVDSSHQVRGSQQAAQRALDEAAAKLADIQSQISDLQTAVDKQPSISDLATLTRRKADLEHARFAAEDAVEADRAALARLEATGASAVAPAATQPDSADPSLAKMRRQLADLTAELTAARGDQAAGVTFARRQLEDAAQQFNDQLVSASGVLDNSSQLKQFVDSAKDSQLKARELINMLLVDGEDLEKQLEDTRRDVEDLIRARQQDKWSADPQLQQLQTSLDSAQHRYNADIGQNITDPRVLDPLQKEIDSWNSQVKARQAQLGVDPSEVKVEDGLNRVIQSLRRKLNSEKVQIDQVLDPLEKQLTDLNPVVAALPDAQQELARRIHQRLAALNDARQHYADAVGEGETAPSAKVTDVQKQIDALKATLDRRQTDLSRQTALADNAQRGRDVDAAQAALAADVSKLDAAKKAYDDVRIAYDDASGRHEAAVRAQTQILGLEEDKSTALSQREAAQQRLDESTSASDEAYEMKPFDAAQDITVLADSIDPRWNDSLYVIVAAAVIFGGLAVLSRKAAGPPTAQVAPNIPGVPPPGTTSDGRNGDHPLTI